MISICDFEDSFTFNLFSDLIDDFDVQIIKAKEVKSFLKSKLHSTDKEVIILGPGPGHPSQYKDLHEILKGLILNKYIFLFGVCLGHQLIWEALGKVCSYAKNPIHGQSIKLDFHNTFYQNFFKQESISMQRYNSLAITLSAEEFKKLELDGWELFKIDDELLISYKDNILTYQYHPESIGTSSKNELYTPVKNFLI